MDNTIFSIGQPDNEPGLDYRPGSVEHGSLMAEIERQSSVEVEIPLIIGGREVRTGNLGNVVMPCDHGHRLAVYHMAGEEETRMAISSALEAREAWAALSWVERASITMKAAELISKKHRYLLNAATMLGQGKNAYQAEIDAVCETVDYLRFNAWFASEIYQDQPVSTSATLNRMEYRPLEGFVFTITPFNFTAIASNLNMSVALMGNATVWKPATSSLLSSYHLMRILQEAGLPDGVVNFLPGRGSTLANVALSHPDLAGIHFTGSTSTFRTLWKQVASNLEVYRSYPRLVGETGGKDFIFVHASADPAAVATSIVRGAFEYQGQKCSAASRAYIPASMWPSVRSRILAMLSGIRTGDVRDSGCFVNAVIDRAAWESIMGYIDSARSSDRAEIIAGGSGDSSKGWFIEPTVIVTGDPHFVTMEEEIFGPVMTLFVYEDDRFAETLELCNATSPYALTGAVFSRDRYAFVRACQALRYAAGNFYINDKPTGAMVGQQPFGGARLSGTNDKAGGPINLMRWVSPRTIKETFLPAEDYRYPFLGG